MELVTALLLGLLLNGYALTSVEAQTFQLPPSMKALEGSCVVIPCKFTYAGSKPIITWIQDRNNKRGEIYNSKNSSSVLKSYLGRAYLVGDLAKGECSLKINKVGSLDDGRYFPQIDSDPPAVKVESNDSVSLSRRDNPDPIWISGPTELEEGKEYLFQCNAKHTCSANPPKLIWNPQNQSTKTQHKELANGEWEIKLSITYKADSEHNGQILKCSANYPNNKYEEIQWRLQILYPPKMVSVLSTHGTGRVRKGDEVALTCRGVGNPAISWYTWYKNNQSLLSGYGFQTLYINRTMEDKSGEYYCVASNHLGETKSEPIVILCADCDPARMPYWGGVVAAVVLLLLLLTLALVIAIWYRRRRKASVLPKPAITEAPTDTNIYMNVLVSDNPIPITESPYTALQTHNRCSDYEQLQLQDIQATSKPPFQTSSSYSEYEEVIPYRSHQNTKWKY